MDKMINAMMKRYLMFVWMGLIIVLIAFWMAYSVGANGQATFFSVDKATREAAGTGSIYALANAARHSIATWIPMFKFLGLGIMLGAITMALGSIIQTLRVLGKEITAKWSDTLNPGEPEKPRAARMFPMLMMMGWMVLFIGLIWALSLNGTVVSYWNHSIANELNPAQAGSALLNQLRTIVNTLPWLNALRFTGMALLFTAITVALTVVIRTLQFQEKSLEKFLQAKTGKPA
ncbi:MAG: hypothetical protein KAJ53_05295 [Anaerolineales bacterium]|nr:hypothetical protein [Anaerolineales bacterium]